MISSIIDAIKQEYHAGRDYRPHCGVLADLMKEMGKDQYSIDIWYKVYRGELHLSIQNGETTITGDFNDPNADCCYPSLEGVRDGTEE